MRKEIADALDTAESERARIFSCGSNENRISIRIPDNRFPSLVVIELKRTRVSLARSRDASVMHFSGRNFVGD